MDEIADLRAELDQLRLRMTAIHGATTSILHVVINAAETAGIDRIRLAESLINSAQTALEQEPDKAQTMACDLIMAFAQITIARPEPRPRPTLRPIDGGKCSGSSWKAGDDSAGR